MIRRILAGVILGLVMLAAAAMVARVSMLDPHPQIGTMDSAGD